MEGIKVLRTPEELWLCFGSQVFMKGPYVKGFSSQSGPTGDGGVLRSQSQQEGLQVTEDIL